MKSIIYTGVILLTVCFSQNNVFAYGSKRVQEAPAVVASPESAPSVETPTAPVEMGNKICPVSGEEVGEMGETFKMEYEGKIYNLCCAMCAKDFKKDPEKYIKKIEEEMESMKSPSEGNVEEKQP